MNVRHLHIGFTACLATLAIATAGAAQETDARKAGELRAAAAPAAASLDGPILGSDCFAESFDTYADGSFIAGQRGWAAWDDDPFFGEGTVTNMQSLTAPHALEVEGDDDIVHQFGGFVSGQWTILAHQYVPSTFVGDSWFIVLNTYAPLGPKNWSLEIALNSTTGLVRDVNGAATLPAVFDAWVEIRVEINLDGDSQSVYYDNQLLVTKSWTDGASGGGVLDIAAIDLWANASSPVFYDDVALCQNTVTNVMQSTTHPTIQSAINHSANGDVIEAQPRIYQERINYQGKSITVRRAGLASGADVVIDGGGVGPVVSFVNGEGPDSVLEGVLVTGGVAFNGGGVLIDGSSPTITGCSITQNTATGDGAGMAIFGASSPNISGTGFLANTGVPPAGGGGALLIGSSATFDTCVFEGNTSNGGGAILLFDGSSLSMRGSVMRNNSVVFDGGAINCQGSIMSLENCFVSGNVGQDSSGAAITSFFGSAVELTNCSVAGNTGNSVGGLSTAAESTSLVTSCIFWGNAPGEVTSSGDSVTEVNCSNVQGGWSGDGGGNIDADPLFVDQANGDLHLLDGSPCVNAGCPPPMVTAGAAPPDSDIDGEPRVQQCQLDIGADETPFFYDDCNANSIADACEILEGVGLDDGVPETEIGFQSVQTHLWANSYDAGAGSRIGGVSVAVGGSTVMAGDPITVYLWDDPNDDGLPDDAVLLASASGTIQFENGVGDGATPAQFEANLVLPKLVTGMYFVGAETTTSDFPASIDFDDFVPGRSWINNVSGTPGLQASFLVDGQCGVCDGNWLLRPLLADRDGDRIPDDCDCLSDFDNDGETGFQDLLSMLAAWGPCPFCPQDLNGDGEVGFSDLLAMLAAWGPCDIDR